MANAAQKITLSPSRDIPFNKLVLAQTNVRHIKAGVSIEELAASIARRGLIQSIHVRPVLDAGGEETGMFEVPAGGRRYRALEMLVNQKRLAKTASVPCVVGNSFGPIAAAEISLAENIEHAPLHPLDQYRAFKDMRDKGMSEEEIAVAFFISVNIVKQRLKLTTVSPALLDVYADDGMTIAQLEAFSVSSDHTRQEQVWDAIKNSWSKEPYQIRRMLTEGTVRASDKRTVFVGLESYEAAGGEVLRDLFQSDDGGWLQDVPLLERLVSGKLWLRAYEWTTDQGAAALNDYARANDPFSRVGKQQVAVDISSVIRASPGSFRVAWIEHHYENGQLSGTERWTAILTIVTQMPNDAERLRANPLGIYVNAINWSREMSQ